MQQPLIFQSTCKDGTLFVDQANISVMAPLRRLVWSLSRKSVTNILQKPGVFSTTIEIYFAQGVYSVQTIPKQKANEFVRLFAPGQLQQPQTVPSGIPIDVEIQRVKLEIEQRRLQLKQVNANMSTIRAHYQQKHLHGGGKLGSIVRAGQQGGKDAQLRKQQPIKERLGREKLALERQLNQLKLLKTQGITHITPSKK